MQNGGQLMIKTTSDFEQNSMHIVTFKNTQLQYNHTVIQQISGRICFRANAANNTSKKT